MNSALDLELLAHSKIFQGGKNIKSDNAVKLLQTATPALQNYFHILNCRGFKR